jgi:hypothetical protein
MGKTYVASANMSDRQEKLYKGNLEKILIEDAIGKAISMIMREEWCSGQPLQFVVNIGIKEGRTEMLAQESEHDECGEYIGIKEGPTHYETRIFIEMMR